MLLRFWMAAPLVSGVGELSETEAHHARTVLRLTPGCAIEVFDGNGAVAAATLVEVSRKRVTIDVAVVVQTTAPEPAVILATAVPKGDRFDWIVEKATELGVRELIPLRTHRSSVEPRDSKLDRLRQVSLSACKQSGRNHLLTIHPVCDVAAFWQAFAVGRHAVIAEAGGQRLFDLLPHLPRADSSTTTAWVAAVGPEGGWTTDELQLAEHAGAHRVTLGPHILRTETAAVAISSLLMQSARPAD